MHTKDTINRNDQNNKASKIIVEKEKQNTRFNNYVPVKACFFGVMKKRGAEIYSLSCWQWRTRLCVGVSDREQVSQLLLQDTQTPYEGEYKAYEGECQKAMTFVETNSAFSEERPGQTTFFL